MLTEKLQSLLNDFNNIQIENETTWIKINELKLGRQYEITYAKRIETKFGDSIVLIVNDKKNDVRLGMYLPKRFNALSNEQIQELKKFNIIYKGSNDRSEDKYMAADNIAFTPNLKSK